MNEWPTIHATAVLVGARAVLIRGPAGSGKSKLALRLLQTAGSGSLHFARLVADDRVHIEAVHGVLLARPAAALAGLLEVRGLGVRRLPYEPVAAVSCLVDLAAPDAARLPDGSGSATVLSGVTLPRLPVAPDVDPIPAVLTLLCSFERSLGTIRCPI